MDDFSTGLFGWVDFKNGLFGWVDFKNDGKK